MLYSEKYEEFFGDADWNIEDEIMKTPIANSPNQTHEFKNSLKDNKGKPWIDVSYEDHNKTLLNSGVIVLKPRRMKLPTTKVEDYIGRIKSYPIKLINCKKNTDKTYFNDLNDNESESKRVKRLYSSNYKRDNYRKKSSIEILKELFRKMRNRKIFSNQF